MELIKMFWLEILWCDKKNIWRRTAFRSMTIHTHKYLKNMPNMDVNIITVKFPVQTQDNLKSTS